MRRHQGRDPRALGLAGAIVIAALVYLTFAQRLPFTHRFQVTAIVKSSNGLRKNSPVRIAGVDVGKVDSMTRGPGHTTAVTFELSSRGRPIKSDATLKIRPRLFLEGGFYIDLKPGSPSASELHDGGTIPLPQTAIPVQFNQVLNTLDRPTRASLRSLLARGASSLSHGAARSLGASARPGVPALRDTAIVEEASLGTQPHDVSRLIGALSRITGALASGDAQLGQAITAFDRTTSAFAAESAPLARTVAEVDGLLARAPRALRATDAALPPTTQLAAASRPALRASPPVLRETASLLTQLQGLVSHRELPTLTRRLGPTARRLPALTSRLITLFGLVAPVSQCLDSHVLPVFDEVAPDGALSSHEPIWHDLLHSSVGLASAAGEFDNNGPWIRYIYNLGKDTLSIQDTGGNGGKLVAAVSPTTLRQRPTPLPLNAKPPLRPDAKCIDQPPVNLASRASGTLAAPGAPRTQMAPRSAAQQHSMVDHALAALRRAAHRKGRG
jgi:phospholipid/cholesterol/gamma-HCH transport system substrate-binding protein